MEKIEIRASKSWRLFLNLLFLGGFIYVVVKAGVDNLGMKFFFIVMLALAIASNLVWINNTRLAINDNGIAYFDPQLDFRPILFQWDEIENVEPGSLNGKGVDIKLSSPNEFKKKLSIFGRFNLAIRKLVWKRVYWIPLTMLEIPAGEAELLILQAFEKHKA
ncbi:MAG: hypothetical protein JXA42_10995 [Anaerolineales bacterium]|nr:hypothetical protein [Anaerolineales bacterium]